jgi:hypothetical protein
MLQPIWFKCILCGREKCILCGRENWGTLVSGYRATRENQLRNLQYRLEELEDGQLTVEWLRQGIGQMCRMCQMLLIGISGADDRLELRERITIEVQSLLRELGIREKRTRKLAA